MSTRPPRIMLMYISEISGHHSATVAVEKAIRQQRPDVEILNINAFHYTNPISEKIVNKLYMGIIKRTPQIWDYLYDNPAVVKRLQRFKSAVHKMNSPKLQRLFERFKPDVVSCSQAFPCGMVADYKRLYGSRLPLVAMLTDYVPHAYWIYDEVNYYVAPAPEVAQRLVMKGVPADKIKTFGIPFDPRFTAPVDAERVRRELGFSADMPVLLLMGGGQGLGPIKVVIDSLNRARMPFQQIIVTGSNKKLYKALKRKAREFPRPTVLLGYAQNVHELMSVSDMVITKPGGITTAEALAKRLPMIIIKPIPGQEANNTAYLTGQGAAVKVDDPYSMHAVVDALLGTPQTLLRMREAAARISKPRSSADIAALLLSLSNG